MKGAVLYGPRDVRFVEREDPKGLSFRLRSGLLGMRSATHYVGFDGVPHGVEFSGEKLFFTHVHLQGGPAPVRRFLPS